MSKSIKSAPPDKGDSKVFPDGDWWIGQCRSVATQQLIIGRFRYREGAESFVAAGVDESKYPPAKDSRRPAPTEVSKIAPQARSQKLGKTRAKAKQSADQCEVFQTDQTDHFSWLLDCHTKALAETSKRLDVSIPELPARIVREQDRYELEVTWPRHFDREYIFRHHLNFLVLSTKDAIGASGPINPREFRISERYARKVGEGIDHNTSESLDLLFEAATKAMKLYCNLEDVLAVRDRKSSHWWRKQIYRKYGRRDHVFTPGESKERSIKKFIIDVAARAVAGYDSEMWATDLERRYHKHPLAVSDENFLNLVQRYFFEIPSPSDYESTHEIVFCDDFNAPDEATPEGDWTTLWPGLSCKGHSYKFTADTANGQKNRSLMAYVLWPFHDRYDVKHSDEQVVEHLCAMPCKVARTL